MALQARLVLRNGIKHSCDTVGYIVTDHISDKQHGQKNSDCRIDQIQQTAFVDIDVGRQRVAYQMDQRFQHKSRHSGQNADQQRQYDDKRLFLYMTLAPHQKHHEGILKAFCYGCEKQFHFFPFLPCLRDPRPL